MFELQPSVIAMRAQGYFATWVLMSAFFPFQLNKMDVILSAASSIHMSFVLCAIA